MKEIPITLLYFRLFAFQHDVEEEITETASPSSEAKDGESDHRSFNSSSELGHSLQTAWERRWGDVTLSTSSVPNND